MKTSGLSFIVAGLIGAGVVSGCDYAKQADVDALRKELSTTQDSVSRLWKKTQEFALAQQRFDTIIKPPICPGPKCPMSTLAQDFPPPPVWVRMAAQPH